MHCGQGTWSFVRKSTQIIRKNCPIRRPSNFSGLFCWFLVPLRNAYHALWANDFDNFRKIPIFLSLKKCFRRKIESKAPIQVKVICSINFPSSHAILFIFCEKTNFFSKKIKNWAAQIFNASSVLTEFWPSWIENKISGEFFFRKKRKK